MKKDYSEYQYELEKINISKNECLENSISLLEKNNLICFGKDDILQWFGTNLIQKIGEIKNNEVSSIYGRLASNFEDFCYQLCHSKPWGFEMGRNLNAVTDVLRGNNMEQNIQKNSFLIWYNAEKMFEENYEYFKEIFDVFFKLHK